MKDITSSKISIFLLPILLLIQKCSSEFVIFTCPSNEGATFPEVSATFSANIKVNYAKESSSVELRHVFDARSKNRATEFWSQNRHVKYIHRGSQLLIVKYIDEDDIGCRTKTIKPGEKNLLEEEDAGPNRILEKLVLALTSLKGKYALSNVGVENSMFLKRWESCINDPAINISLAFADSSWKRPFTVEDYSYLSSIDASDGNEYLTALFSNFKQDTPDETEFQPPENVYCADFLPEKKPPSLPDYFSYDAETTHWYSEGQNTKTQVSNRRVYYDYPASLSRTDFYNPKIEDRDLFSPVRGVSIIHDFNSDIQYIFDPVTGKCTVDSFEDTVGPIPISVSTKGKMVNGNAFFSLDSQSIGYNGKFSTRGYLADVYTDIVPVKEGNDMKYSWYFSADSSQDDEKSSMKSKLLRMFVRHDADEGSSTVDVNFFNFVHKEPDAFTFDLSLCYNDSFAKTFVLTFPAFEELKGSENLLRYTIQQALRKVMILPKQRIFVSEVFFSGNYMYAEFRVVASPSVTGIAKMKTAETSLEDAVAKLTQSVSSSTFNVTYYTEEKFILLKPEPNGLNEFAGDRKTFLDGATYKEGSVIALTIGMLLLGVILGGVTINLIISRKYGVSLFRKSNYDRNLDSLGESSM